MTDLPERASRYISAISGITDIGELALQFREALLTVGMTGSASGIVSGAGGPAANRFHFINWPQAWLDLYQRENFIALDPAVRWSMTSGLCVTWSDIIRALPPRVPALRVIQAAREHGFREGVAVPLRNASGALGLVGVAGNRSVVNRQERSFIQIIATATFHQAEDLQADAAPLHVPATLSPREIDCLVHLVRGHSDAEMALALGVSEATVRFHCQNARAKLGARSRTHMAALAITMGIAKL